MMQDTVATLSAMITPVVVIAACSSLVLATTQRIGRTIARARKISEDIRRAARDPGESPLADEEMIMLFDQMTRSARRVELLQQAAVALYVTIGTFVLVSIAIGVLAATQLVLPGLVTGLAFFGAIFLLYASTVLIQEAMLTRTAMRAEMAFLRRLSAHMGLPKA